nr:hypothetical protein [Tanacetum cinerariifolium]
MNSTQAFSSNPSKKIKLTIIPPRQPFVKISSDEDVTTTPSPTTTSLSLTFPNEPSKTSSTNQPSSSQENTSSSFQSKLQISPPSLNESTSPQPLNPLLDNISDVPHRPSNHQPLQSHPSLDITFSLSPITPLDHILDSPSPPSPQPQPPLMVSITELSVLEVTHSQITYHASRSSYPAPHDRWSRDQHIELVSIIGEPTEGELTYFLGLQIKQDDKGISIFQEKYTRNLPNVLSQSNFTKNPYKVTTIELTASMIDVINLESLVTPLHCFEKKRNKKTQTVTQPKPKLHRSEALGALPQKGKKSNTKKTSLVLTIIKPPKEKGLHSIADEDTRKSSPWSEAKTIDPQDTKGNTQPDVMGLPPAHPEKAAEAYTRNSTNFAELLTLVRNFDFLGFKSSIESLQADVTAQNDHLAKWVESSASLT